MTPYKDPDAQRVYQANWVGARRREWLLQQRCSLCGDQANLRIFRHPGAPRLSWSVRGPSHSRFCVVCADATQCLQRRAGGECPPPKEEAPAQSKRRGRRPLNDGLTKYERQKRMTLRGVTKHTPRTKEVAAEKKAAAQSRTVYRESALERELAESDDRPSCPTHGPGITMALRGAERFVCCGRVVSTVKPKKWGVL